MLLSGMLSVICFDLAVCLTWSSPTCSSRPVETISHASRAVLVSLFLFLFLLLLLLLFS